LLNTQASEGSGVYLGNLTNAGVKSIDMHVFLHLQAPDIVVGDLDSKLRLRLEDLQLEEK